MGYFEQNGINTKDILRATYNKPGTPIDLEFLYLPPGGAGRPKDLATHGSELTTHEQIRRPKAHDRVRRALTFLKKDWKAGKSQMAMITVNFCRASYVDARPMVEDAMSWAR